MRDQQAHSESQPKPPVLAYESRLTPPAPSGLERAYGLLQWLGLACICLTIAVPLFILGLRTLAPTSPAPSVANSSSRILSGCAEWAFGLFWLFGAFLCLRYAWRFCFGPVAPGISLSETPVLPPDEPRGQVIQHPVDDHARDRDVNPDR